MLYAVTVYISLEIRGKGLKRWVVVLWSGKQAVTRKAGGTGVSGTEDRLESKGASTEEH